MVIERRMSKYLILFRFTQKGIENIKESPDRVEAAKQLFRDMNAEVEKFYGGYDTKFIVDAPDDETIVKTAATLGSWGYVKTETLRAFTEEDYRNIIEAMP